MITTILILALSFFVGWFLADIVRMIKNKKKMINYYIIYKKDNNKNFEKEFKNEGEMLDFIMMLEDGDLANYKVFEQLI